MTESFVGEIQLFAGTFAPADWHFCDGSLLQISEYDTLFSLIGTTYGGDGVTTFALPDLRGRVPIHMGAGPGLPTYSIGQAGGVEQVTLTPTTIPTHSHSLAASGASPTSTIPTNLTAASQAKNMFRPGPAAVPFAPAAVGPTGGSQPHSNFQPYLCLNFIISLYGIYPSRP